MVKGILSGTTGVNPAFPIGRFNSEVGSQGFVTFETSNWGQEFDDNVNPQNCIVTRDVAGAGGAPALPSGSSGTYVCRCEMTQACVDAGYSTRQHNKFYQVFPLIGSPSMGNSQWAPYGINEGGEAGEYAGKFYFPSTYSFLGTGATGAQVNIFQFKQFYYLNGTGTDEVQPQFAVSNKDILEATYGLSLYYLTDADHDRPVLIVLPGHNPWSANEGGYSHVITGMYLPRATWFKLSARIYPGVKMEFLVNDALFETVLHTELTAGIRHKTASVYTGPGVFPSSWSFGVGHYGANVGKVWIKDVYAEPLRTVKPFVPFNPAA